MKAQPKKKIRVKKKARAVPRWPRGGTRRKLPSGHALTMSGLIVPEGSMQPLKPSAMQAGIKAASKDVDNMLVALGNLLPDSYSIKEIELTLSFNADGKFLGFGVGGAASITVKVAPE